MIRAWVAAAVALGSLALAGAATAGFSADADLGGHCAAGDVLLGDGRLDEAVNEYLVALDADAPCADARLKAAAAAKRLETQLCAEGDDRAALGRDGEAQAKYADALNVNVASECAREGIAARPESKSRGERFFDYLPAFPVHLGSLVLMAFVGLAVVGLVRSLFLRKASLLIRPFADGAVEPKVGPAFAGLVEEELVRVWRTRQGARDDGYALDLVVANVELLSADQSLDDAVGQLAQVPQLELIAGLVGFIDRLFLQRRLAAVGELLPEGDKGCGVSVSLYKRSALQTRGTLWETPAGGPAPEVAVETSVIVPEAGSENVTAVAEDKAATSAAAARYYGLAGAAGAWVQYEAARVLDARVGVITSSAQSFSLLSAGLDEHRAAAAGDPERYPEAKRQYCDALALDSENVAALFNLALFVARHDDDGFSDALSQLERARLILDRRYSELPAARGGSSTRRREELADPTWYRIRYALAAQRLHAGDAAGAESAALDLINSASVVLAEIGWRWVGSKPPWFTSWYKRGPAWIWQAARRLFGRPRLRTIDGDWKLARLLARTVEPAAVLLWWSARVEQGGLPETPEEVDKPTKPLDRWKKRDKAWLERYLVGLSAAQPRRAWHRRAAGWLGRSRWRTREKLNHRVNYNLACLFSRLAVHAGEPEQPQRPLFKRSARFLTEALEDIWGARRGELANWASRDPGLAGLRADDQGRFRSIVAPPLPERDDATRIPSTGFIRYRNAAAAVLCIVFVGLLAALVASIWWDLPYV